MVRVVRPFAPRRFGCHLVVAANRGQRNCQSRCCRSLEGSVGGSGSGVVRREVCEHSLEHTDCSGFVQWIVSVTALR